MRKAANVTKNNQIANIKRFRYLYGKISIFRHDNAYAIEHNLELLHIVQDRIDKRYTMTGMLCLESSCREVPEEYLWRGELAATVFAVGCYRVRIGIRCYDEKGYEYAEPQNLTPLIGEG